MIHHEVKTGQSVDAVKEGLISPVLSEYVLGLPELPKDFSLIDIGSGDATASRSLLLSLLKAGHHLKNLALVDADITIFPDLMGTATSEPISSIDTQVLEAGRRDILQSFLEHYEEKYDLALSQLVFHQIESDSEVSYLMYLAYRALKSTGNLLLVNLHPEYLEYLGEHEPDKFKVTDQTERQLTGTYHFDSSGTAPVYSRNIEIQLAMLLGLGFDLTQAIPIATDVLADQKPRYRQLAENDIPMFYLMHVKKNPSHFVSSTEGVIKNITPANDQWMIVDFIDGDQIKIPKLSGWENIHQGSGLVLHETRRKGTTGNFLNYWVIDPEEKVTGGQITVISETENPNV